MEKLGGQERDEQKKPSALGETVRKILLDQAIEKYRKGKRERAK